MIMFRTFITKYHWLLISSLSLQLTFISHNYSIANFTNVMKFHCNSSTYTSKESWLSLTCWQSKSCPQMGMEDTRIYLDTNRLDLLLMFPMFFRGSNWIFCCSKFSTRPYQPAQPPQIDLGSINLQISRVSWQGSYSMGSLPNLQMEGSQSSNTR